MPSQPIKPAALQHEAPPITAGAVDAAAAGTGFSDPAHTLAQGLPNNQADGGFTNSQTADQKTGWSRRAAGAGRKGLALLRIREQRWLKRRPALYGRLAEALAWPAFFIFLSNVSNPGNPFYVNEGFPWPWLGPWLIALRYGVGLGAAAALGLLAAWLALAGQPVFPRMYFLGGAITTLIAGEFGGYWTARVVRLRETTRFLNDKVERLTRSLYLTKLSHDEMEYELVDLPGTLRGALVDLRALMNRKMKAAESSAEPATLPAAKTMLDFIGLHCSIETAAMYEVTLEPALKFTRVAVLGVLTDPPADDPMVLRALESGRQTHLQDTFLENSHRSELLAAAPLMDANGLAFGLMVIKRMPFHRLTVQNLQTVSVLLESYADYLRLTQQAAEVIPYWPDAPRGLAGEFAWLARMRQVYGLESHCVVWRVVHDRQLEIIGEIEQLHSQGETSWRWPGRQHDTATRTSVISLVPFATPAMVHVYKQRIVLGIQRSFGDLLVNQLRAFDFAIDSKELFEDLHAVVEDRA